MVSLPNRTRRKWPAAVLGVLGLFLLSCNLADQSGRTFIHVDTDSAWLAYDSLDIVWKDVSSDAHGTLFQGKPEALDSLNKLPAEGYQGQKIDIIIKVFQGGELVRQETRHFDGKDANRITSEIVEFKPGVNRPNPDTVLPANRRPYLPSISLINQAMVISIGDSVDFSAAATVDSSVLKAYEWDYDGDSVSDDSANLSGKSVLIKGRFRYFKPGEYTVTLKVVTGLDSLSSASITVLVRQDLPTAYAGLDMTVFTDDTLRLQGIAKDSLGRVVLTEWKFGDLDFSQGRGDTTIAAPAKAGDITCIFRVTDDDSQSVSDTVVIHVVSRSESVLTGILPSKGTLTPQFNPGIPDYVITIPYPESTLTVIPSGLGAITVNGVPVLSGKASLPLKLSPGKDTVRITVKLEGVPEITYSLSILRSGPPSGLNNAVLSNLVLSAGEIISAFTPDGYFYSLTVANGISNTQVTATTENGASTLAIDNRPAVSGSPVSIDLPVGIKYINIVVTAPNAEKKSYTVAVTRAPNANAYLKTLEVSDEQGRLGPVFDPKTFAYDLSVSDSVDSIWITPVDSFPTSIITVNQTALASGTRFGPVALKTGANRIDISVTAQSGATLKYTVTVNRSGSGNKDLAGLELISIPFSKPFASGDTAYFASVPNEVRTATLRAKPADSTAVLSFDPGAALNLDTGLTLAAVTVTAQDGTKKKYTIQISRAKNGNADLSGLALSNGTLVPDFQASTTDYSLIVPNEIAAITVTSILAAPTSGLSLLGIPQTSGKASASIPLRVGTDTLKVIATAEDGTQKAYAIAVTRMLGTDATLKDLTFTATGENTLTVPFSPNFSPANALYTYTTTNFPLTMKVRATATHDKAKIKVNGIAVPSGEETGSIALKTGSTSTLSIEVTSEDGSKVKSYSLTIASQKRTPGDTLLRASGTFIVPPYVTSIHAMWAGGGGGGGSNADGLRGWTASGAGGGGGQGGVRIRTIPVAPGDSFSYTIGSGGKSGPPGGTGHGIGGAPGSPTTFFAIAAPGGLGGAGGRKRTDPMEGGIGGAAGISDAGSPVKAAAPGEAPGNGGKGGGYFTRHFPDAFGNLTVFAEGGLSGIGANGVSNTSGGVGGLGCGGGGAGSGDPSIAGSDGGPGFVYIFWGI